MQLKDSVVEVFKKHAQDNPPKPLPQRDWPVCESCGNVYDQECCWCGSRIDQHTPVCGHSPIPIGCICGYPKADLGEKAIYRRALDKWGPEAQLLKVAEECSELAAAVLQYLQDRVPVHEVAEEIADVEIMLGQMRLYFGVIVESKKQAKLERLADRLEEEDGSESNTAA